MICRVRGLATCLPLPLGLVAVLARPVAADRELLRCPSVPAPQAAAQPVSPAVGALDTFRPRDSRSAAGFKGGIDGGSEWPSVFRTFQGLNCGCGRGKPRPEEQHRQAAE